MEERPDLRLDPKSLKVMPFLVGELRKNKKSSAARHLALAVGHLNELERNIMQCATLSVDLGYKCNQWQLNLITF